MSKGRREKKCRLREWEKTRYQVSRGFKYELLEATCTQHTANGWLALLLPDGTILKCRPKEGEWLPSRLDVITFEIERIMKEDQCSIDKLQELFDLRSRYQEEWKLCPICEHQYEDDCACEHVVSAYSQQGCDDLEEDWPLLLSFGILDPDDLLDIYLAAKDHVATSPLTSRSGHKGLPKRLVVLLRDLVYARMEDTEVDDHPLVFHGYGLARAFDRYLQTILHRGPTFQKTETWETEYGYGTFMTVVHWAEDAVRCADYARKEIESDVKCLRI